MRRRPTLVMAFWQQAELFLCSYIMQCSIVFSPSVSLGGSDEDPERFGGENLFPVPLIPDSTSVRHTGYLENRQNCRSQILKAIPARRSP